MRHSNISMLVSVTRARSLLYISAGPIDAMIGAGVGDTESGTSDGGSKDQAWDWVLPLKTEICLSSGAAVSLLGGFGGHAPPRIFFNWYSLLQSGSIKIHMYCTRKKIIIQLF